MERNSKRTDWVPLTEEQKAEIIREHYNTSGSRNTIMRRFGIGQGQYYSIIKAACTPVLPKDI